MVQPVSSDASDVLAVTADGDGEVVLVHHHVHGVGFLVHDDGRHLGRLQRADHELRRLGRPQHDVDVLAADLVAHGGDAGAAQADAGADRVDARVVGLDADLGAQAGSRAQALISSRPSSISGLPVRTGITNSGAVRERISCGPRAPRSMRSR
jgi:hypothetical protein